jgi:hypothetical protein
MLAFCTSPSEISLVLGPSDARWLSEEMSFLSELYLSKAGSSERQFGEEGNVALASFLETAAKCQQLSVALQQAVGRGHHASGASRDQPINVSPARDRPHPVSALPSPEAQSGSAERLTRSKRARRGARGLLRYVTGKSCKRGHVAERWMSASSRASAA